MADIFGFSTSVGNGFIESEKGIVIGGSGKLSLVQSWNVNYQQNVQPIYECGTSTVYFAAKHASGTFSCERIVAESPGDLKDNFGTVCGPKTVIVEAFSGKCRGTAPVKAQLVGSVLQGITFSGSAQQAYVGESLQVMFAGLEVAGR